MLSTGETDPQLIKRCEQLEAQARLYTSACASSDLAELRGASTSELEEMDHRLNLMQSNLRAMAYGIAASTPSNLPEFRAYVKAINALSEKSGGETSPEFVLVRSLLAYLTRLIDHLEKVGPAGRP